jgi:hypothetical protein
MSHPSHPPVPPIAQALTQAPGPAPLAPTTPVVKYMLSKADRDPTLRQFEGKDMYMI